MHLAGLEHAISAIKHPKTDGHRNQPTYWYLNKTKCTDGVENYLMITLIFYTKHSTARKEHIVVCKRTEHFFSIQVKQYKDKHNWAYV